MTDVSAATLTRGNGIKISSNVVSIDPVVVPQLGATPSHEHLGSRPRHSGAIVANSFSGDGTALTNVNAALLGGLAPSAYQLALGYIPAHSGANSDITSLSGLTTALPVTEGGTGDNTLTQFGVLVGNGSSAVTSLAAAPSGTVLTGQWHPGNDPTFSATPTLGRPGTARQAPARSALSRSPATPAAP